ncbi:UNVERIFIED_CONTAM: hypothetical protein FKN15_025200 [Acipenser sinensis]
MDRKGLKSLAPSALRNHHGEPVINGNWAIDRPGIFTAAGTTVTYRRPNEISTKAGESIIAKGPTSEVLDVYCSVPCGVGQRTRDIKCVDNLGDVVDEEECNLNLKPEDSENCDAGPCARSWFLTEWSERCSAECGNGTQTRGVVCLMNHISSLPLEGCGNEKPMESKPCNFGLCNEKVEWFTGPWDQCSTECGNGTKSRSVVCLKRSNISLVVVEPFECSRLEKPPTENNCYLKKCGAKWFTTEWSAPGYRNGSVPCSAPYRTVCTVQRIVAPYHVHCVPYTVPYRLHSTLCTVHCAPYRVYHLYHLYHALCTVPFAPYHVYHVYCALCAVPYRVRHTVSTMQVEQLQTTHIEWQQEDLLSIAASEDMAAQEFPSEEGNSDSATPVVVISSAYAADAAD